MEIKQWIWKIFRSSEREDLVTNWTQEKSGRQPVFLSDGKRIQEEQATPRVKSTTETVIALGRLSLYLHLGNRMLMGEKVSVMM